MPKDLNFWIGVIVIVLALGAIAIWRWGKNISFKVGGVSMTTTDAKAQDPVTVAKNATVDGSVGEVIGRSGMDAGAMHGATDVAEQMKVGKGARVDRIVGVEAGQPKQPKP